MKKYILKNSLSTFVRLSALIFIAIITLLSSCKDEPLSIQTFKKEMMGAYLENRAEFSQFKRLLDTTEVLSLVNTYGEYTMFAPSDSAMFNYYKLKGKKSLSDFTLDTLKRIAYDHIIKGYELKSDNFIEGLLPYLTMSDRFVSINSRVVGQLFVYYVNQNSAITLKDVEVSNGIIHVVNRVLDPSTLNIGQAVIKNERFKIFSEALQKTGLIDSLKKVRDFSYDPDNYLSINTPPARQGGGSTDELPVSRKYGYTIFVESDETLRDKYGITSFEDLKNYAASHVYNEDASDADVSDIEDRRNSLNKFVSYHLINRKLPANQLIDAYDCDHMIKTFDMYEYIETMCPNTLIEIKKERSTATTNLINKPMNSADGDAIHIIAKDSDAINGVYHEIDKILIYDANQARELSTKRLRMDAASFFPELVNNNMRYYNKGNPRSWVFPQKYIERLTCTATTKFSYLNACDGYLDYQGDEVFLSGMYDFSVITPPIPAGTYEVRFGYQPTAFRGAAQLYWDNKPCGIPLDLRITADNPLIGFVVPGSDPEDPLGYENDKMMKNRMYMKGPNSYKSPSGYGRAIARQSPYVLRRILLTITFDKTENHTFTVKAVRSGQFMFDFLEFVPVEILETEGID
jgi:uncharacterized surface protein with fasciclin (FAS1) repeats